MVETPRIELLPARRVLEVSAHVPLWKLAKTFGTHFPRLAQHISASGSKPDGAPFARYLEIDWDQARKGGALSMIWMLLTHKQKVQVGMPAGDDVPPSDDMKATEIPAGQYVQAVHKGPYHKLNDAYKTIIAWADSEGLRLEDISIENYVNDPTTVSAEEIETLVQVRVLDTTP